MGTPIRNAFANLHSSTLPSCVSTTPQNQRQNVYHHSLANSVSLFRGTPKWWFSSWLPFKNYKNGHQLQRDPWEKNGSIRPGRKQCFQRERQLRFDRFACLLYMYMPGGPVSPKPACEPIGSFCFLGRGGGGGGEAPFCLVSTGNPEDTNHFGGSKSHLVTFPCCRSARSGLEASICGFPCPLSMPRTSPTLGRGLKHVLQL